MEILFNERIQILNTPNINAVTYALMVEDERLYKIAEAKAKGGENIAFNPDAEMQARYTALGKDFGGELRKIKLKWS